MFVVRYLNNCWPDFHAMWRCSCHLRGFDSTFPSAPWDHFKPQKLSCGLCCLLGMLAGVYMIACCSLRPVVVHFIGCVLRNSGYRSERCQDSQKNNVLPLFSMLLPHFPRPDTPFYNLHFWLLSNFWMWKRQEEKKETTQWFHLAAVSRLFLPSTESSALRAHGETSRPHRQ